MDNLEKARKEYSPGTVFRIVGGSGFKNEEGKEATIPYNVEFESYCGDISYYGLSGYVSFNNVWATIVSKPELILGKWYEFDYFKNDKYIFKLTRIDGDRGYCDDYYHNGKISKEKDCYMINISNDAKKMKLADMEEVYKHFPEERPKIEVMEEWCVKSTVDTKAVIKKHWAGADGTAAYYGIRNDQLKYYFDSKPWGTILTIEEFYKKIGYVTEKPMEENLIGRYLKAKVDHADGVGGISKGDYTKIISQDHQYSIDYGPGGYVAEKPLRIDSWELMPVGWTPEQEKIRTIETVPIKTELAFLPEKWCLKITPENREFCKSLKNNELGYSGGYNYTTDAYYGPKEDNQGFKGSMEKRDRIEITFEQFKKWVLKEPVQEGRRSAQIDLLEEAKRRYPIGTVINSLGGSHNEKITTSNPYYCYDNKGVRFNGDQLVYNEGKWAQIVSETPYDKELVQEMVDFSGSYTGKPKKKGFDEKEHLSKPYNQKLDIQIKKVNKKQTKLQLL